MVTDLEKQADEFRKRHGIEDRCRSQSEHPIVEVERMKFNTSQLLANDKIESFSQHYVGKYENLFGDETIDFSLAYTFAIHPCDDIASDLDDIGITKTVVVKEKKIENGIEIETEIKKEVPIEFIITPWKILIEEILRRRHSANRKRVGEFIDLNTGTSMKDMLKNQIQTPQEPQVRGRIF